MRESKLKAWEWERFGCNIESWKRWKVEYHLNLHIYFIKPAGNYIQTSPIIVKSYIVSKCNLQIIFNRLTSTIK